MNPVRCFPISARWTNTRRRSVLDHPDQPAHPRHHPRRPGSLADVHRRDRRVGPRYCPSIEDKIHRFADKDSHQIFLEPEGLQTHEVYPNGISTSLPFDIPACALVRSIRGLEHAHLTRPGYAIEYDFLRPARSRLFVANRAIQGLFFAGQINGTTGYEEAAAQGLLAGLNAACSCAAKRRGGRTVTKPTWAC